MSEFENKIGAILNNPDLMSQIMSMANSLGQNQPSQEPDPEASVMPEINPAAIQSMMKLVGKTGIDQNQRALLNALHPYLSGSRLIKLEKAMRAAKLAGVASGAINSGALSFLTGR